MIEFGPFRYDAEARFLYRGDEEIMLPPRVLAVLESLLKRPGKVVAKDAVLESAWDGAFVGEDSLTQAVSQLRRALGDDPQRPTYIQTIPKRGYRFIAEVSEALVSQGPVPAPLQEQDEEERAPSATDDADRSQASASPVPIAALAAGTAVGNYELVSQIGAGAMGEVWRARDTELRRDVAIKVVPQELGGEAAVVERFRREALMLAAVNHPNIATIHGVEEVNGRPLIVMELLHGETLQERLSGGALPVEDALNIAVQIARALAVAHNAGIVHRDLKPGNIMLGAGNHVKVLDFGLAKEAEATDGEATVDPTLLTASGLLVGTAAYMSPEQAAGKPIDKRSDIFSFGCVLFEMLAGQRPFAGDTASEMVAAILKDAPDLGLLPKATSPDIRALLRRCLRKDPDRRTHDIADARIEVEESFARREGETRESIPTEAPSTQPTPVLAWAAAGLMAVAAGVAAYAWWVGASAPPPPRPVTRFAIDAPIWGVSGSAVLVTPDGESLIYALGSANDYRLYRRRLDELVDTPIAGTEDATLPFLSPDGQSLGFVPTPSALGLAGEGELRQVSVNGGTSAPIADFFGGRGATWAGDSILFNPSPDAGIHRVAAVGGPVREVTAVDPTEGESAHYWPHALPDGESLLFTAWKGSVPASEVVAFSSGNGARTTLVTGTDGRYAPSGHLVFARDASLMAVAFDLDKLEVGGDPVQMIESLYVRGRGAGTYSFSETGTLAYVPDPESLSARRRLVWVDRSGNTELVTELTEEFGAPRLSPDGSRIAVTIDDQTVWILNPDTGTLAPLSPDAGLSNSPVWSPDGEWVAFGHAAVRPGGVLGNDVVAGEFDIYRRPSDSSDPMEPVLIEDRGQWPQAWTSGGEIAYVDLMGVNVWDVRLIGGDAGEPEAFGVGPANMGSIAISPNGQWAAYWSDESGSDEIYVQPFPGGGEVIPISNSGGEEPLWSRDGREIFYRSGDRMMVVEVSTETGFAAGRPRLLFEKAFLNESATGYDISLDGQHFLMVEELDWYGLYSGLRVVVVLNWFEELKQRVPTGRQ